MVPLRYIIVSVLFALLLVVGLIVLTQFMDNRNTEPELNREAMELFDGPFAPQADAPTATPATEADARPERTYVEFVTNRGAIRLELYTELMPVTTENFLTLAENGFYDNTKFHRVIDGFMIQGGDPNSRGDDVSLYGRGGPGYTISDEFVSEERLTNTRGTIAMANTGQPNSGGSQFFINVADNTGLDFDKQPLSSRHPVFGRVVAGMEVVDAISQTETGLNDVPTEPVIIETIRIVNQ